MSRLFIDQQHWDEIQRRQANGLPVRLRDYTHSLHLEPARKIQRRWYRRNAPKTLPAGTTIPVPSLKTAVPVNRAARRRAAAEMRTKRGWRSFITRADRT